VPWSRETIPIHPRKKAGTQPISTPIYQSATFQLADTAEGARNAQTIAPAEFYTRWGNPTTRELEHALAQLEGAEQALCTASGMGAISSAIIATLGTSGHVVAQRGLYSATAEIFDRLLPGFGCRVSYFDPTQPKSLEAAYAKDTRLVYVESPANPTMEITDLKAVVASAKKRGIPVLCDNTFANPLNQNPIDFGVTGVLHSMTKYIGGHSDATGGVVLGPKAWIEKVWFVYKLLGASLSPHEAWLFLRGLKTIGVRNQRHNTNAQKVAEYLAMHPKVAKVHYPGLATFPQHALAKRQMRGFGGMMSFELKGGYAAGKKFCENIRLASLAVSLGGVETLVQHPASMTHGVLTEKERARGGVHSGLIRISVGIEEVNDLLHDFDQALAKA
jgi:methionine-gamma-lyase